MAASLSTHTLGAHLLLLLSTNAHALELARHARHAALLVAAHLWRLRLAVGKVALRRHGGHAAVRRRRARLLWRRGRAGREELSLRRLLCDVARVACTAAGARVKAAAEADAVGGHVCRRVRTPATRDDGRRCGACGWRRTGSAGHGRPSQRRGAAHRWRALHGRHRHARLALRVCGTSTGRAGIGRRP